MNKVIETINNRVSLRRYKNEEISKEHIDILIESAMKAPTAGNQQLYSILLIRDNEMKKTLSKTCDNQGFIANAPLVMVFLADQQKWFDYFKANGVSEFASENNLDFENPQESDLFLAIEDTMIAAHNVVLAAESLGIGTCYIGDIVENYEIHQEILNLPDFAYPITMLTLGYYPDDYKRVFRQRFDSKYVVFDEKYRHLTEDELNDMFKEKEARYSPDNKYGAKNFAQQFYARKTGAAFSKEMARSVRVALKKWDGRKLNFK